MLAAQGQVVKGNTLKTKNFNTPVIILSTPTGNGEEEEEQKNESEASNALWTTKPSTKPAVLATARNG